MEDDICTQFGKIKCQQWENDVKNDPLSNPWILWMLEISTIFGVILLVLALLL